MNNTILNILNKTLECLYSKKLRSAVFWVLAVCTLVVFLPMVLFAGYRVCVIHTMEKLFMHRTLRNYDKWHKVLLLFGLRGCAFVLLTKVLCKKDYQVLKAICRGVYRVIKLPVKKAIIIIANIGHILVTYWPYILALFPLTVVILRASCSAMTWDEALTYRHYALPLCDNFSRIWGIYKHSVANNHWVNTVLIAIITKLTKVRYNEFVIRVPVLLFAFTYYFAVARCREKGLINTFEFTLLCFSYYLNEFFGLARGYGMAACLVFIALILFKRYLASSSRKLFFACCYVFILSAYANSVTLLLFFSVGIVALAGLIKKRLLLQFIKQSPCQIAICVILLLAITYYHFHTCDITGNDSLFMTDKAGFIFYVREYLFIITQYNKFPVIVLWIVGITSALAFVCSVIAKKGQNCELSIAMMIHTILLVTIASIFKHGTLLQRLLLPSYPLVVLGGGGQMFANCCNRIKKRCPCIFAGGKVLNALLLLLFVCNFYHKTDLLHTHDWHDGYQIRTRVRNGEKPSEDGAINPCWFFYQEQMNYLD